MFSDAKMSWPEFFGVWAVISGLGDWKERWITEGEEALLKEMLSLKNKTVSELCSTENTVP